MKHVLIVDDNQMDRFITRSFVEKMGYVVHEIFDGNEIEHALNLFSPDLIILDLLMPHKDGFETLEEIHRKDPAIPVVVLSCVAEEYKDKVDTLNAQACFQKPYDAGEFMETVKRLIEQNPE